MGWVRTLVSPSSLTRGGTSRSSNEITTSRYAFSGLSLPPTSPLLCCNRFALKEDYDHDCDSICWYQITAQPYK